MVALIGLFGMAAFVLASFIVGFRILLLARRTRGLPETVMGGSLVLAGGVGTGLAIAPRLVPGVGDELAYWLYQLSTTCSQVGFLMVAFFVWRVFRPNENWARALLVVCALGLSIGLAGELGVRSVGDAYTGAEASGGAWVWTSLATRFVIYGWSAIESFRYWSVMRRRLALGLAEPTTVGRFYYWGLCNVAVEGIWIGAGLQRLVPAETPVAAWLTVSIALLGFAVAWTLWAAFFPRHRAGTPQSSVRRADVAPR